MNSRVLPALLLTATLVAAVASTASAQPEAELGLTSQDWPWWRGPRLDGSADADQDPPMQWGPEEGILWQRPIPGRGHGSPIVVGDHVYLPTADRERQVQSVLCLSRETGELIWETVVHRDGLMKKNEKASQASSTMACDGERLFVNFLNDGAVFTTALDRKGRVLWQQKVSDYVIHQGYGSSPLIYHDLVIVAADNKGGGALVAFDRETGEVRWKQQRPEKPNYASPIVVRANGKDQLVMTGCELVSSFDPDTGKKLWEIEGATTECVTSTVTDGQLVYSSGGYPRNHVAAIRADGSGEVAWETGDRVYVPSMLIRDGYLYAVMDAGVAICWEAATGREQWKARLGGNFTASPVLVGDRIYATDEDGTTTVFRATPEGFERLARSRLGDDAFATPTIVGGRIYARHGVMRDGKRQEVLYCLGGD
ncbi:PQQ-binding-like beta-propeller repeat protein [Roseiconus nitratireducens]|uniref:PQQ-binding-like beta-propeller repeat protein n=1 Tax=Roseiconus nitratireducens TaxID=2605748 RepID=A0A5M6D7V9_9BACT|nr:PQQ-binding-like beta-propeller repeat protein [Roseiconus nitratireducens]KAA5542736.1 PQQ-binding-like beta-propeller repeat protein [Roseiconus nitratireducens]